MFNKYKLAITTECPLSCRYCFVKKDKQVMDCQIAKRSIDFIFQNSRRDDLLSILIYGGEPLLFPGFLKKIIRYSTLKAKRLNRKIFISVGTNGVLLNRQLRLFFQEYNVRIALSLGGSRENHNQFRYFSDGRGSFDDTLQNLKCLINDFSPYSYYVSLCLHPSQSEEFYKNFLYFFSLGVRSFHIVWIHDTKCLWTKDKVIAAKENYIKIWQYIFNRLKEKKPAYLVNFLYLPKEILGNKRKKSYCCFSAIEISPSGKIYLSPFLLSSTKHMIGDIYRGLDKSLFICNLGGKKIGVQDCATCREKHFKNIHRTINNLRKIENEFAKISNKYLKKISGMGKIGKEYISTLYKSFPF